LRWSHRAIHGEARDTDIAVRRSPPYLLPTPYCRLNVENRGDPVLVQQEIDEMRDRLEKLD